MITRYLRPEMGGRAVLSITRSCDVTRKQRPVTRRQWEALFTPKFRSVQCRDPVLLAESSSMSIRENECNRTKSGVRVDRWTRYLGTSRAVRVRSESGQYCSL